MTSLVMMIWVAYATWYQASLTQGQGLVYLLLLAPVYAGSAFLFSYGYELYDLPRALRLTAILVFISIAAVVILAVLFALLGKGNSDSSTSDGSGSSSGRSSSPAGSRHGSWGSGGGSIDLNLGGDARGRSRIAGRADAGPVFLL